MRIALIAPIYPYRGGIAQYSARLAEAIQSKGDTVMVVSFLRQYPGWLYPGKSDREPTGQPLVFPAQYLLDPLYPWTWEKAFHEIVAWKADRVVFAWWTTFWAPAYAWLAWRLRQAEKKVVFLIHNVLPHEVHFFDRWLARLVLRQGTHFIVQSSREEQRLRAIIPIGKSVSLCLLPGIIPLQEKPPDQKISREQLGLDPNMPVLLFFGLVRPYKGLRFLIEAAGSINQSGRSLQLLIVGEFWEKKEIYVQLINQVGLSNRTRIEDRYIPDQEIPLYFSAADVFVAPYIGGTQSAVLKLALGFNLPIVVTDLISEGLIAPSIRVVPPANVNALKNAISDLINTDSPRKPVNLPGWEPFVAAIHDC